MSNTKPAILFIAIFLPGCASTPLDYTVQDTDVLCYMAVHEKNERAAKIVADRLPGGVQSDACEALSEQHRQALLEAREAKRKRLQHMVSPRSEDHLKLETPDLPGVTTKY